MSAPRSLRSQPLQVVLKVRAGPGLIIGVWRLNGTARNSGVPVDMQVSTLYTIRYEKIVRLREYFTMDEAARAAGLE